MNKYYCVLLLAGLLIACQTQIKEDPPNTLVDSLASEWAINWNNHDSIALMQMFDEDAVLFDNNIVTRNPEELKTKLILPYYNILNDMKITILDEWVTNGRAGLSGTWTVDIMVNDTESIPSSGAFTCVWKKLESGEWKVTNAHIHDFTR